ncbi:MAG: Hsp70 family protein [Gammaproteobacteria bacterium]|nr:Hsp70 family protein [Gammaproteobacteria bacterium]
MTETIIGIDLGTTNSEVAVVREGQAQVLEIQTGNKLLPSVVGFSEDGTLLVGEPARNQYALYPQRTIRSVKRLMGEDSHITLGEQQYTPQEISAIILRHLKSIAEQHLGEEIHKAVITVPAYFSDAQRQATREAGTIAGLEVVRIINEPTAASLAFDSEYPDQKVALVYDLGGGTFDVSVVRMERDVVEVLASHGNNKLGGDDFDQKIIEHIEAHIKETHQLDPISSPQTMARITQAAEAAKIALSDQPYVQIEEEYLLEKDGVPVHLSLELARHDYEEMIADYVDETLRAIHTALEGARMTVSDLNEVLLVGGSTRTPVIARRLEEELRLQPRSEIDPDLCVASGAAIQAAMIAGEKVGNVLVDITPYTFGTSAMAKYKGELYPYTFVPLIKKNTPIPVTKTEVFYTIFDGQDKVEVNVYQGEDSDALNNTKIGRFMIEGLSDVPQGNPLLSTFSLDLNGILHVTSQEKNTGLENSIRIDNAISRFENEEMAEATDRVQNLFGEPDTQDDKRRENTRAQALIEKAQRLMEKASDDDREDMVDLIETINDALQADDDESLEEAIDQLSDVIFYLEA